MHVGAKADLDHAAGAVDAALAGSRQGGTAVVVDKLAGRCYLLRGGRVAAAFPAELGDAGLRRRAAGGVRQDPHPLPAVPPRVVLTMTPGEARRLFAALLPKMRLVVAGPPAP